MILASLRINHKSYYTQMTQFLFLELAIQRNSNTSIMDILLDK